MIRAAVERRRKRRLFLVAIPRPFAEGRAEDFPAAAWTGEVHSRFDALLIYPKGERVGRTVFEIVVPDAVLGCNFGHLSLQT